SETNMEKKIRVKKTGRSESLNGGWPRRTRAVRERLPGKVMRAKPMMKRGNPPGPGKSRPMGQAARMRIQPTTFLRIHQKYSVKKRSIMMCRGVSGWSGASGLMRDDLL